MVGSLKTNVRFSTAYWMRVATIAMFGWTTTVDALFAQTPPASDPAQQAPAAAGTPAPAPAPADQAADVYSITDLEYLLGPIALYPDPLLALILPASTHPDQIAEAARWLESNAAAVARNDFTEVDAKPWDPSVQALTRFPDTVKMLAEHLDWTESLGWAFSVQDADVAAVIQMLRAKAESAGNLKSTPEQAVTTREEGGSRVIYIAPTNPERIYVPVYDSSLVFDTVVTGALVFGTAVLVGSAWNNQWGWNNRSWNQVWIRPPGPGWRPPVRPIRPPPGAWRPGGPGRPPGVRPDRPGIRPPGVRPDRRVRCDPTVPAFGLTGRAIGQVFLAQVFPATGRIAPAYVPTGLERVPTVPLSGRIVQPIDRPDRKHGHNVPRRVPTRGHRGQQRGHNNDLHPARASSPLDRSHGRAGRNSARRYSGPPTVRMCSALRPIDPDRSRGHGLRRNGRARKEVAICGNKQPRLAICSQFQSVRADVVTETPSWRGPARPFSKAPPTASRSSPAPGR